MLYGFINCIHPWKWCSCVLWWTCGLSSTWIFLCLIPLTVDEATTGHVNPALREHKQWSDHRSKQGQEEAQRLQGWAASIHGMSHQHQSLWIKGRGILFTGELAIQYGLRCGGREPSKWEGCWLLDTVLDGEKSSQCLGSEHMTAFSIILFTCIQSQTTNLKNMLYLTEFPAFPT